MKVFFSITLPIVLLANLFLLTKEASAVYTFHSCNITQVQFVVNSPTPGGSRVTVHCQAAAPGGIVWFAYQTQQSVDMTKIILSMLTSAQAAGRTVKIGYESTDTTGDSWGCQSANCRTIMQLLIQ